MKVICINCLQEYDTTGNHDEWECWVERIEDGDAIQRNDGNS